MWPGAGAGGDDNEGDPQRRSLAVLMILLIGKGLVNRIVFCLEEDV